MKSKILIILGALGLMLALASCADVLDRPDRDSPESKDYWKDEDRIRMFANGFYQEFFAGYNSGWGTQYAPVRGYTFHDDVTSLSQQSFFESKVPSSLGNSAIESSAPAWRSQYAGPTWYFGWIIKANTMLTAVEGMYKDNLIDQQVYAHWMGVGRFFRALEYSRLVGTFGDVPYYDRVIEEEETDELFKARTPRDTVMARVLEDFEYALDNIRGMDKDDSYVNKYVAAAFASRWLLFEGTWQKYHYQNNELAEKYLNATIKAADVVKSGGYSISGDFRSLFGSTDLSGNSEVILSRRYNMSITPAVGHHVASYCNTIDAPNLGANLEFIKSVICNDGNIWQKTDLEDAKKFDLESLFKTRDSRFEATFWAKHTVKSPTLVYCDKFISREPIEKALADPKYNIPDEYRSINNVNSAPVIRYSEVLLNWIEAKAELEAIGVGDPVSQRDIDESINAIRDRPLDVYAEARGVKKTAPLQLASLPNDPARDADVPELIWEIRRERRIELFFEHSRLLDIKRWKKINYMNNLEYPDYQYGVWVTSEDLEALGLFAKDKQGKTRVRNQAGSVIAFDGKNQDEMEGYYMVEDVRARPTPLPRNYLSPIGEQQINLYNEKGYKLDQTPGW